ncbi:ribonuclease M5 [Enterococcus sp. DIV0242_7C1]|uniref:Ribonuclease M5 n=2 Tax=Enterococcus TaxID=1350 RepID=A0A200J7K0_9ENTE|nr:MULTISPECIES: ribonuclease M5 [unclassified Enterococcus]MBO0470705.1 ribonuclease M5 [Enterococcus sp. DIV0242_7C1]OUZ33154.1 ribonuclease M5 [Enterococcus sp. 9D6_DIV0238]
MTEKLRIEEIIVVEGKDDTRRIQEVVDADTIETIGSAINEEILEQIEHAQETRGVIIFTDPDYSGEKIRKTIMDVVPDAKHAFLSRRLAAPKKRGSSLGVEHASDEAIVEALEKIVTPVHEEDDYQEIPRQMLIEYGLIAGAHAKERREKLGDALRIGYTNSKQLTKRLKMFRITEKELTDAMNAIIKAASEKSEESM